MSLSLMQRGVFNEDFGVFIDTTNILITEKDGKHSITFEIINDEDFSKVKNLVLNAKDDGSYSAFITEYILSQSDLLKLANNEPIGEKTPTSVTDITTTQNTNIINSSNANCVSTFSYNQSVCWSGDNLIPSQGDLGDGCTSAVFSATFFVIEIDWGCVSGGGSTGYNPGGSDSGGYNPGGYWSGGGSGSSGGSQTNPNNPILTTPNINYPTVPRDFLSSLTDDQLNWWNAIENSTPRNEIIAYLNQNKIDGTNVVEAEAMAFALEIINSGLQGTLISAKPYFKYPPNSNYATLYPNFTSLVKDYMEYLRNDNNLIGTISDLTGQSNSIIIEHLTWGRGAEINVVQLGNAPDGTQYKGMFNPLYPDKIFIDIDLVQYLENLTNQNGENDSQVQLLNGLIVFSVCLHELVHFEDFNFDGLMQGDNDEDLGELFESIYQGGYFEFDENNDVIFIKAN